MAYLDTPDLAEKNRPTGEEITDHRLPRRHTPLSSAVVREPSAQQEFTSQVNCLKGLQAVRRTAAYQGNERKREILRERDLAHSRDVNHNRMVAESNELRELTFAVNNIAAQRTNVELIKAKQRQRLNERLAEFQYGAEYRSADVVHSLEEADAERLLRRNQKTMKEAYDKQVQEKEKRLHAEHLALEEERAHIDKVAREENQKHLDAAKTRLLEKQRWQDVIRDFQEQRQASKDQAAEDLRKENEKIARDNVAQEARSDGQKALRDHREKVADELRNRLVAEMQAKDRDKLERAKIAEELVLAENEEKEMERRRQVKLKKANEREELRDTVRESRESHTLRETDWKEYQQVLKLQSQAEDRKAEVEAKIRQDRQTNVVALLDQQREDHRQRAVREKQKEDEWEAKEEQDCRLWREFVDVEREKCLRKRAPELTDYLKGYHRFQHKKDDQLVQEILKSGGDAESALIYGDRQPLAKISPQPGSTHDCYRNLQDARLAEIYGVGSR